ncbi:MAG TPA: GNAT family N-acetyltransferase [Galbitalea sp.]|jgi:GNAT superfamily N-acetyltransferase|nr:GNAT family N-acetyltransferase [Galbitalea sp.]
MVTIELIKGSAIDTASAVALYASVGWSVYTRDRDKLSRALSGSSSVAIAVDGDELVGLARVVSDGASIAYLQDVLVKPAAQRTGLGRRLVEKVLEPLGDVRQKVLLTDDEPGQRAFYESIGFSETRDFGEGTLRAFVRFD